MGKKIKLVKGANPGKCPYCGSTNIEYCDTNFEDGFLYHEFICNDCNKVSEEWYKLEFVEVVGKNEKISAMFKE